MLVYIKGFDMSSQRVGMTRRGKFVNFVLEMCQFERIVAIRLRELGLCLLYGNRVPKTHKSLKISYKLSKSTKKRSPRPTNSDCTRKREILM